MAISKRKRQQVYNKCNGKCAYCGKDLNGKFQVDHVEPFWHTMTHQQYEHTFKKPKPTDKID